MGKDGRTSGFGGRILLVAMAIQGLTPDPSDLASPRLLRLVVSTMIETRSPGDGPAPSSVPTSGGQHGGVPGEFSAAAAVAIPVRGRPDREGRPVFHRPRSPSSNRRPARLPILGGRPARSSAGLTA